MADIFAVPSLAGNVTIRGLGDNHSAAASTLVATNEDGPVLYKLKQPRAFGAESLAASVPRPRLQVIRFHGVLAPHAKLRKAVVPPPVATARAHPNDCYHPPAGSGKGRMRWEQLLKRVLDTDVERCSHCGGQLKLIAAIEEPAVIQRTVTHLGLAARPPPRAATVRVDLFEAA